MKSTLILAACATVALAQRTQTEWDWTTVTVTVNPESTGEVDSSIENYGAIGGQSGRGNRGGRYRGSQSSSAAPAASSTEAAVVVEVQQFRPNQYGGGQGGQQGSRASSAAPAAQSSEAPASSSDSSDSTPVSSNLGGYKGPILDAHNIHRANHSVPAVQWSDSLASIAAQIAASCVYEHDTKTGGGGYGQNIGAGTLPDEVNAMITNAMYNGEINDYPGYGREPDMGNFHAWGHYSQIVWKSTTEVGCATQYCPGGLAKTGSGISPYFTVCNYKPAGNFGGQYAANVLKPLGKATVVV